MCDKVNVKKKKKTSVPHENDQIHIPSGNKLDYFSGNVCNAKIYVFLNLVSIIIDTTLGFHVSRLDIQVFIFN